MTTPSSPAAPTSTPPKPTWLQRLSAWFNAFEPNYTEQLAARRQREEQAGDVATLADVVRDVIHEPDVVSFFAVAGIDVDRLLRGLIELPSANDVDAVARVRNSALREPDAPVVAIRTLAAALRERGPVRALVEGLAGRDIEELLRAWVARDDVDDDVVVQLVLLDDPLTTFAFLQNVFQTLGRDEALAGQHARLLRQTGAFAIPTSSPEDARALRESIDLLAIAHGQPFRAVLRDRP